MKKSIRRNLATVSLAILGMMLAVATVLSISDPTAAAVSLAGLPLIGFPIRLQEEQGEGGEGGGAGTATPPKPDIGLEAQNRITQWIGGELTKFQTDMQKKFDEQLDKTNQSVTELTKSLEDAMKPIDDIKQRFGGNYVNPKSLGDKGYSFARAMFALSGEGGAEDAPYEVDLGNRLRQRYGQSDSGMKPGAKTLLVPLASQHIHRYEKDLADECRQAVRQGLGSGPDPLDMARIHQQTYGGTIQQALSIYDDSKLGLLLGPTQTGEMIDFLRAREVFTNAGAREITLPPNGRISFTRQTGTITGYWMGKGTSNRTITESDPSTDSLLLAAKKLAALVKVPNDLIKFATENVEAFIRTDIALTLARTLDLSLLTAVGDDYEPKGLINYSIQSHTASTVGANGDTFEPEDARLMKAKIEDENIEGDVTFVMRSLMHAVIATRRSAAHTAGTLDGPFVFQEAMLASALGQGDRLAGSNIVKSTQVPKDRSKGAASNLSMVIAGAFAEYLIGRHGVLELANADQTNFSTDETLIRAIQYVDGVPRREKAFIMCDKLVFQYADPDRSQCCYETHQTNFNHQERQMFSDLINRLARSLSLLKNSAAATVAGTYKDIGTAQHVEGTYVEVAVDDVTGSPTSFTAEFRVYEADDSGGTNAQEITDATTRVTLSAAGISQLRVERTKPWLKVDCVLAFVGGTSPKASVAGILTGWDQGVA